MQKNLDDFYLFGSTNRNLITNDEIKNYFNYIYNKNEMDELGLYLQICFDNNFKFAFLSI